MPKSRRRMSKLEMRRRSRLRVSAHVARENEKHARELIEVQAARIRELEARMPRDPARLIVTPREAMQEAR